jgi:hypothetical protein
MENKNEKIKNLTEYNERKLREVSFNNVKIMVLKMKDSSGEKVVNQYIEKHFEQYQDEDEKQLLITFLNANKVK